MPHAVKHTVHHPSDFGSRHCFASLLLLACDYLATYVPLHEKIGASPAALRRSAALRNLVRETQLSATILFCCVFVAKNWMKRRPIGSMPEFFSSP